MPLHDATVGCHLAYACFCRDAGHVVFDAVHLKPVVFVPSGSEGTGVANATIDVESPPDQKFEVGQVFADARSNLEVVGEGVVCSKHTPLNLEQG